MTLADARAKGAMVVYTSFGIFALVHHGNFAADVADGHSRHFWPVRWMSAYQLTAAE